MEESTNLKAAELISRSLSGELSGLEKAELEDYLQQSDITQVELAKSFANLSEVISRSTAGCRSEVEQGDERLSAVAKERMRRSIRKARSELTQTNNSPSDTTQSQNRELRRVAEAETGYFTGGESGLDRLEPTRAGQSLSDHKTFGSEFNEDARQAVARFTLLNRIGKGGLGTVWLARDERLKRNVALKEMNPEAAGSARLWQRFQREAEITGHLEHPNVVPLYMSGVNPETGLPFYVMRFLGKQTLSEAIREYHAKIKADADEPVDLHRLLNVFQKICQAIAYAHSRGVIHRDLKPENVILDNFGQVLVLDWGLAKLETEGELALRLTLNNDKDNSQLTQTLHGDVVGTPLYMAPEQAAGDLDSVDARTDVYGLGAILFAILTGEAPHESSHQSSGGTIRVDEFLTAISKKDAKSPREINPNISADLDAICRRALAREKFARFHSANELASAVENWIAGRHQQEKRYDCLRMAGRDLKSRMCVQLRQLVAQTLFAVELPPVQGLAEHLGGDEKEYGVWRDRMSQILMALTKTKPNITAHSFTRFEDDRAIDLVRVERSQQDPTMIRNLPQSRLNNSVGSQFQRLVLEQLPGECLIEIECTTTGAVRLMCGAPVFKSSTEEPFGLVVTETEIGTMAKTELDLMQFKKEAILIDQTGSVLYSSESPRAKLKHASEILPQWDDLQEALEEQEEYLDPKREIYATRLHQPRRNQNIYIVCRDLN